MPQEDLLGRDWENRFISNVLGGLDLDNDPDHLEDGKFLTLNNMIYFKGILAKDTGYAKLANTVIGNPRKVIEHITASGVANTFLITNTTFCKLNSNETGWELVQLTGGFSTTLSLNISGGATTLICTSIAGMSNGDVIAVRLDSGLDHITTINGTPSGSSVPIADALPGSGTVATSGNAVIQGVKLSGTNDNPVDALTVPWSDQLVFTNNVDDIQYYDPTTTEVTEVPNLPSTGDTQCKALAIFDSSLVLISTTEGGSRFNQRVRWSDKADITEWAAGDSGFVDLLDSTDKIQTGKTLGPYLIIYREKSINRGTFVGSAIKRFDWPRTVTKHGAISPGAVADVGDKHFVVGKNAIYFYRGGFEIDNVGENVDSILFGHDAEMDESNVHTLFTVYIEDRHDVWIFYQIPSGTLPNRALRYSLKYNCFTKRLFSDQFLGYGTFVKSNAFTWNDLVGTWEDQTFTWSSTSISGNFRTLLLCRDDGQVVEYDYVTPDDDGTAKVFLIETPDIAHPNAKIRHDYIELRCAGGQISVEYSINGGINYSILETITPGTDLTKIRLEKQFVGERIRYRISGSSTFKLIWYNIRHTIETEW